MAEVLSRTRVDSEFEDSGVALHLTRHLRHYRDDMRDWKTVGLIQFSHGRFRDSVSALKRASLIAPLRSAAGVYQAHRFRRFGRKLSRDFLIALSPDESLPSPSLPSRCFRMPDRTRSMNDSCSFVDHT